MAERISGATKRLIFMLWYRDWGGGVVEGKRWLSVVCTVRVSLYVLLR